jgi:hypothetical protein
MKLKTLHPIAAALVIASLTPAVMAAPSSHSADAQAQAAALLSPPVISGTSSEQVRSASRVSVAADAQSSAAALLSGSRVGTENAEDLQVSDGRMTGDAQAQAAALLSGASHPVDARRSHEWSSKVGL